MLMWEEIQKYNDLLEIAVTEMKKRSIDLAKKEYAYRLELSKRLTELRAEGQAVTHLADMARGEPKIAKLRLDRDIAKGVYDSSQEAINMYKIRIRVLENQYAREWRCCKMSKRSKACEISQKVKTEVWLRDSCSCIYCKKWAPKSCANAHFIKRSQRRHGHRRKHSYIVPRLPLSRRFWTRH